MILALTLLACSPRVDELPEISGIQPAEDHDPKKDVVEVHLTASRTGVQYIDAGITPVWAFNEQVPGPLIHARVGDTLRVIFTNDLPEPTTIHWHGLRIDNDMDGVPAVQDPIQPGDTFTYEFVLPDAGTYWYHPHVRSNEQVERGLYGALVVQEAENIEVDAERYFSLDDIALESNGRQSSFGGGMDGMMGRFGNTLLVNGQTGMEGAPVQPGVVERWRMVNTANARLMYADVVGADWKVVAIDGGILEEPYTTDVLRMPVGRRFDVEVIPRADAETVGLRILIPDQEGGLTPYPMYEAPIAGEPVVREPVVWPPTPMTTVVPATQEVDVVLDVGDGGMMDMSWTINGEEYGMGDPIPLVGSTPTLIRLRDESGAGHPFHLHGQFFEVLSRNGEPSDVPGALDTIHVNGNDRLRLYTTFDNPGLWLAHCHILEHAELGMMTSFDVTE